RPLAARRLKSRPAHSPRCDRCFGPHPAHLMVGNAPPTGGMMTHANSRTAHHPIDPLFLERWSPRAFTDAPISERDLLTLLEAARWAPSSFNSQPWRFLYARRHTQHWPRFLGLLSDYNQSWARNAAALVILVSKTTLLPRGAETEVPSYTHSLDAG